MKSLITSLIIAAGITSSAFAQQAQPQDSSSKYSFYRFHSIHGGSDGFVDPAEVQQKDHEDTAKQEPKVYFQVSFASPQNGVLVYVCNVETGCSRLGAGTYQLADIQDAAPNSGVVSEAVNAILKACHDRGGSDGRVPVRNRATVENVNAFLLKLQASE